MSDELTGKELFVLQGWADGKTNGEIATEMDTTEQTVKNIGVLVRQKLNGDNAANCVAIALRRGIID